jgi:crotonobetainyl-CoA:carnitine CoA-transferase CaiB-like acyl-CoA transferase
MTTPKPLRDSRVLDLSQYIAGSACAQLLADFGATVTKVEPIAGDPARSLGRTRFGSTFFRQYNTGKTSMRLDLGDTEQRAGLDAMLAECDAVVMNFAPRTLRKHGLDWKSLHEKFPGLVVVLISAYGEEDPRTAFDSIAQAVSGFGFLNADEAGGPRISAGYPTDVFTGLYAGMATAMALLDDELAEGVLVDAPMIEVAMSALCGPAMLAGAEEGHMIRGAGNRDAATAPSNTYACADGHVYIYAGLDKHWSLLRPVVDGEDAPLAERLADPARFDAMVESWTKGRTVDDVVAEVSALGIAVGPVADPLTALRDLRADRPDAVVAISESGEAVPQFPIAFSGARVRRTPAPALTAPSTKEAP